MLSLQVEGSAIDVSSLKKNLTLSSYSQRFFKVAQTSERVETPKKRKNTKNQVREKRLQEILYGENKNKIKKKKFIPREKLPLPISSNIYPSYQILTDLYKSQKKTLEEMKLTLVVPFDYEKAQHNMFDMTILLPYISEAYQSLYKQHIEHLKDIIKSTAKEETIEEDIEKKVLHIKGIMESENSIDSEFE